MHKNKLTLSQLEQYLSKAAWILKGPVDASDFKVYIFPLLFFKRISDVYDEEFRIALEESNGDEDYAALPEFHRFEIPQGCHWNDVRETSRNEATSNSDIDIVVAFDGPASSDKYFGVQFYLEDNLGIAVDLVTEKAIRKELRPFIEQEAVNV